MARLQTAVLCNAASVEQSGLVSVLGAFIDTITGQALPVQQQLWLAARLFVEEGDIGATLELVVIVEPLDVDEPSLLQPGPLVRLDERIAEAAPLPSLDPRLSGGGSLVLPLAVLLPSAGLY